MDANLQRSAGAETQSVRRSVRAHERRTALPFRQRGTSGQQVGGGRAASAGIGSGAAKSAGAGQLTTATSAWKSWYRYLRTGSRCERQKQFAGGAGGFVVLVWGSSMIAVTIMVVMTIVIIMIIMITTAVIASVTSRIGVVSVLRVTCAGNAGVPGS
jgi:hypothetical protein